MGFSELCRRLVSQHGAAVNRTDNQGIVLYFNNVTRFMIQEGQSLMNECLKY